MTGCTPLLTKSVICNFEAVKEVSPIMPRTAASPLQVRGTAIDITLAHIRHHGFEKVRLSEVAREMGLSHAALYAHFADKAALLDAVSERWLDETRAALDAIAARAAAALQ